MRTPGCSVRKSETASGDISTSLAPFSWIESSTRNLVLILAKERAAAVTPTVRTLSKERRNLADCVVVGLTSSAVRPRGGRIMNCWTVALVIRIMEWNGFIEYRSYRTIRTQKENLSEILRFFTALELSLP